MNILEIRYYAAQHCNKLNASRIVGLLVSSQLMILPSAFTIHITLRTEAMGLYTTLPEDIQEVDIIIAGGMIRSFLDAESLNLG